MTQSDLNTEKLASTLRYLIRPVPLQFEPLFRRMEKNMERLLSAVLFVVLLVTLLLMRAQSNGLGPISIGWSAATVIPLLILFLVRMPHRLQSSFYNAGHILTAIIYLVSQYMLPWQEPLMVSTALPIALFLIVQVLRPGRFKAGITCAPILAALLYGHLYPESLRLEDAGILLILVLGIIFLHAAFHYLTLRFVELEQHRIREGNELDLARTVHESLFPTFTGNERIQIHKYHLPENKIGGDFYDLVFLREGNLGIFLSDVSGHGISSAMMSTALKVVLSRIPYRNRLSPAALLTALDKTMAESYESHHATGVYIFFDFLQSTVLLGNAGHPPVLKASRAEPFHEIESSGSLMGMGLRNPTADDVTLSMQSGDRYLLYTDGLLEYETVQGNIAFIDDLEELLVPLRDLPSDALLDSLIQSVHSRHDFLRFRDDVLVLIAEIK